MHARSPQNLTREREKKKKGVRLGAQNAATLLSGFPLQVQRRLAEKIIRERPDRLPIHSNSLKLSTPYRRMIYPSPPAPALAAAACRPQPRTASH